MKIVRLLTGRDCPPERKSFSDRAFMAGYDGRFPLWERAEGMLVPDEFVIGKLFPHGKGLRG